MSEIKGIQLRCKKCKAEMGIVFVKGTIISAYCQEHIPELKVK